MQGTQNVIYQTASALFGINTTSIDITRIVHVTRDDMPYSINGLILKLIKRNVPVHFIRLLFYWFNNLKCSVV